MPSISSIFLVLALVLGVTIGPQTRSWSWGPAMLSLAISTATAMPAFWKARRSTESLGFIALGILTAGWLAWRASMSPVAELGQADLMLLAAVVGTFISIRAIEGNQTAERILIWGFALLLLANVVVSARQLIDPTYSPLFPPRVGPKPITGFFGHYNEAANYFIASSMIVGAAALFERRSMLVRVLWALIAIAGLVCVWYTRSRGGILGTAVALGAFATVSLIVGKRRKTRWFAPALIGIPLVGLAIGAYLFVGWEEAQEIRRAGSSVGQLLDNDCRLYFLGIAMSCVGLHPMAGGGSRSFGWECFQFIDWKAQGLITTHKPELVHNEIIQAATDYGLIGVGLLVLVLFVCMVTVVTRALFADNENDFGAADAWRVGGVAAFSGMFVQSCFSFVFHLLPGILLLGICLGRIVRSTSTPTHIRQDSVSKVLISAAVVACLLVLLPAGWKGALVTRSLWPIYFGEIPSRSFDARLDALTDSIRIWPQSSFHQERANLYQQMAGSQNGEDSDQSAVLAVRDYERAEYFHRFDPAPVVNRANLLSQLNRDAEAESAYDRAIQLQGGMEPGFRAHFSLANHLMRKGVRQFDAADPGPALASLETAGQQMEQAAARMHWVIEDMLQPRVAVHESLGAAREASGDYAGAMQAYDFATSFHYGSRAHYRAGVLNGKLAARAWTNRSASEAMGYFIEAKRRILLATDLPPDVKPSQRQEYLDYLGETIEFLRGAKVEPLPLPNKKTSQ